MLTTFEMAIFAKKKKKKKLILFTETTLKTLPFYQSFIEIKWLVDFGKDPF